MSCFCWHKLFYFAISVNPRILLLEVRPQFTLIRVYSRKCHMASAALGQLLPHQIYEPVTAAALKVCTSDVF